MGRPGDDLVGLGRLELADALGQTRTVMLALYGQRSNAATLGAALGAGDEHPGLGCGVVKRLSTRPRAETVTVTGAAEGVPDGWSFDVVSNSISFDPGSEPIGASTIEVSYATHPECDGG